MTPPGGPRLRAPGGVKEELPWWGPGGRAPGSSWVSASSETLEGLSWHSFRNMNALICIKNWSGKKLQKIEKILTNVPINKSLSCYFWAGDITQVSFTKGTSKSQHRNLLINAGVALWGGGQGEKAPLKISKKGKMQKYGVFSCIKVNKTSFSVIFNKEIHALLYHDFSTF